MDTITGLVQHAIERVHQLGRFLSKEDYKDYLEYLIEELQIEVEAVQKDIGQ